MSQQRAEKPIPSVSSQNSKIDWQQICRVMLKQSLSVNPLTTQPSAIPLEWEDINLSLGLVEPHSPKFRKSQNLIKGNYDYTHLNPQEITRKYTQQQFFTEVLQQSNSKTKGRRLAILGAFGTGKTALLYKIADWILENTDEVPIWISLADIGKTPLRRYLEEKWLKRVAQSPDEPSIQWQNALEELLNSGRVWLLLDGLEKMPLEQIAKLPTTLGSPENRPMLLNAASAITQQLQGWTEKTRIIVTSGCYVWNVDKNILSSFDIYSPLELSYPQEVKEFISRWFSPPKMESRETPEKDRAKSSESQLYQALTQFGDYRIQEFVQTPLRLALLCRFWQHNKQLPTTQAQLYQEIVTQFYQWQGEKIAITPEQQKEINQGLGKLALKAMLSQFPSNWIHHHLVSEALPEDKGLLNLALRTEWLKPIGVTANARQETIYAFVDSHFQAYFAATAIEDWHFFLNYNGSRQNSSSAPISVDNYRIFEKKWQPIILLWLGREDISKKDKEAFFQRLVEFNDSCSPENFYGKRAYFLAALGMGEFPQSSKNNEILTSLLQWGFLDPQVSPLIADMARMILTQTHRQLAINSLLKVLPTTPSETLLKDLFNTLEIIGKGNPQAITALMELLDTEIADNIRWQIAESLGKIDPSNPKAINTILHVLETTSNEETRQMALSSLDQIAQGNFKAISALIRLLHMTDSPTLQRRVFQSIEHIGAGNATAIAALVQLIRTTDDEGIRRQAAESLEKIDPGNPTAIAVLIQLIEAGNNPEICKQAVYSLGEITPGNVPAITALVNLLSSENDVFIRWIALSSLGKIGFKNTEAINGLVNLIKSDDQSFLQKDAIENLGKIDPDNPEAITALVQLMESTEDESTRREVAEILGKIDPGNPEAIAALVHLLRSAEDEFTSRQAAESLGKIDPGNLESLKTLIRLIQSSTDKDIRSLAAESLGEIEANNPAAIASLIRLTKSTQDPTTLRRAAASLGKIGVSNREVISSLLSMLKSVQDEPTRLEIAESLIDLMKPEQRSEVIKALKSMLSTPKSLKDIACQKIIWDCAQHLSYPDFYQTWHNRRLVQTPITSETIVSEKSPSFSQPKESKPHPENLEQHLQSTLKVDPQSKESKPHPENLGQHLQSALKAHPQLSAKVSLVFIDSNNLMEPENPLVDIYDMMLTQNYPEFEHGIPDTMAKLRLYWNSIRRQNSQTHFVLVFYENLTAPNSQGFSPTFLKMLSKFDGSIALITEQPSEKLQKFSPTDSNLVGMIIQWIEKEIALVSKPIT